MDGNPIHEDMVWAAKKAKLAFIVNVVLNAGKEVIHVAAGDMRAAHGPGVNSCQSSAGSARRLPILSSRQTAVTRWIRTSIRPSKA